MFEVQSRAARSARYWHSQKDHIDMEPEYQRLGGIWSEEDQKHLVDSILNDYDIPKLYLADFTTMPSALNEDRKRYAVIDGKQRLEAIFKFLDNELPLSKKAVWVERRTKKISELYYNDLQQLFPELAAKVAEFPMPIMHVVTDELERINELFVRLNKGSSLTGAEKRNAMLGPVPKVIKKIASHDFFVDCVRFQTGRGQSQNAAAKILLFELTEKLIDTKKNQLDEMVQSYLSRHDENLIEAGRRVFAVLDIMHRIFGTRDTLLSSQGSVPLYYLLVRELGDVGAKLRQFLLDFDAEVRRVRKNGGGSGIEGISHFINAMRNINDSGSYEVRLNCLQSAFREYPFDRSRHASKSLETLENSSSCGAQCRFFA